MERRSTVRVGIATAGIVTTTSALRRVADYGHLARRLGPRWVLSRARTVVDAQLGTLERRLPSRGWAPYVTAAAGLAGADDRMAITGLPVDRSALSAWAEADVAESRAALAHEVDDLRHGRLRFFSGAVVEHGWPPDWRRNVPERLPGPASVHFSRIATFGHGDVKNIWEPGRFGFAWTLARAAAAGLAPDAGRLFFAAVEHFVDANPPFDGPHWMCGQESTFRALAMVGGWSMFRAEASTEDARRVAAVLLATADRIEAHLDYALSQRNNHGLSEAFGLLLVGGALRDHPRARERQAHGAGLLEEQSAQLVYADGGFSQHSANYHRVMMQVLSVAVCVAGALAIPLPQTRAALGRATGLARALVRPDGTQARYGHDDGALVLPWTSCDYDDFRPAIQEALAVLGEPLPFPSGPWDAGVIWLGHTARLADARVARPVRRQSAFHREAGILQLQEGDTSVQLRVPAPRHRPSHLDTMHVDVWWRDVAVAIDLGTFAYNAAAPFDQIPLASGPFHNVVHAPGHDQARRVGRFLFWPWPSARVLHRSDRAAVAEYRGALGPIRRWQRSIRVLGAAGCVVIDRVELPPGSAAELRWHIADLPDVTPEPVRDRLVLETGHGPLTVAVATGHATTSATIVLRRAEPGSAEGWRAPRYQQLAPCWSLAVPAVAAGTEPLFFATIFTPGLAEVTASDTGWRLRTPDGERSDVWWPDRSPEQ